MGAGQGLAMESRRLANTVAALEREAAAREGALSAAAAETAAAQSALAECQLQLQATSADVQVLLPQPTASSVPHRGGSAYCQHPATTTSWDRD